MHASKSWRNCTLGEIAELIGGGTPSRTDPGNFGDYLDWVTPSDLPPIGRVSELGAVAEKLSESGLAKSSAKKLPIGTVLFSSRASIGKIAVTNRPCATNQGFANFVPRHEIVDPWFLAFYLCFSTQDIVRLSGETTYKEVSRGKLREFLIPIPPLPEQRRIVRRIKEMLEKTDEIRNLRASISAERRILLTASLSEFFKEFEKSAPSLPIGESLTDSRYGTSRKCHSSGNGFPVLRIPNIGQSFLNTDSLKCCDLNDREWEALKLRDGDLLVVRTNGSPDLVGRCAVFHLKGEFAFASYLIRLRLDAKRVNPDYLMFFLSSSRGRDAIKARYKTSAGQYNISSTGLSNITFPCPELVEQDLLVARMKSQQKIIHELSLSQSSSEAQASKMSQSILQKAFAGEL